LFANSNVGGVELLECEKLGIKVKLLPHYDALPIVIAAIKTSAGDVKEKGIDYYLVEYTKKKPDKAWEWLIDASKNYPSVLEHYVIPVLIDGCSRSCSHQLVRHRMASYTQESQRYSIAFALSLVPEEFVKDGMRLYPDDEEKAKLYGFIEWMKKIQKDLSGLLYMGNIPDKVVKGTIKPLKDIVAFPPSINERDAAEFALTVASSLQKYAELVLEGISYEDARYLLPNAMRTRILVTTNLREWIHIIKTRSSPHAQWEIRCVVNMIKDEIKKIIPVIDKMIQ